MLQQSLVDLREGSTGEQHRTRRHARGPSVTPLHVGTGEGDPTLHEAIEVRGLDDRIAQRCDGVSALIVSEDEDDIRRRRGGEGDGHG
jgi:hypothetical protein